MRSPHSTSRRHSTAPTTTEVFNPPPLLFVGGTGRSGTHVVSKILNNHSHFRKVPNEARFHTDPGGFPDVLAGRPAPSCSSGGCASTGTGTSSPPGSASAASTATCPGRASTPPPTAFLRRFEVEPEAACRQLFFDLLWPLAAEEAKAGLIEQSCDVVAEAPTLARLFPEAKFIHVVRDGRDAAASRVGQARLFAYPRSMDQGLEWWEARIRGSTPGARARRAGTSSTRSASTSSSAASAAAPTG